MNCGERELRKLLKEVESMTIEEYNNLFDRAREKDSFEIVDIDNEIQTSLNKPVHEHFKHLSENYKHLEKEKYFKFKKKGFISNVDKSLCYAA